MAVEQKQQLGRWSWSNAWKHFKTISRHRNLVMRYCFKVGLYAQGLKHDLSKFGKTEFSVGARYYQGNRSPNNAEREAKGYTEAWLHHKGRNKHHYEYWIDYDIERKTDPPLKGMKMPKRYVVEMTMDRLAACKIYQGKDYKDSSPLEYYRKGISYQLLHPDSAKLLEKLLTMIAEEGEEKTFSYIKQTVMSDDYDY